MMKNTIVDYKNAINAKYEKEKYGDYHGYLSNPTPAQLRDLCLLKLNNEISKNDKTNLELFFSNKQDLKYTNGTIDLRKTILNCDIRKFKTIESFLIGRNKNTNTINLNLIAFLIDFSPRPFNEFNNSELSKLKEGKSEPEELIEIKQIVLEVNEKPVQPNFTLHTVSSEQSKLVRMIVGVIVVVLLLLGFLCFLY